MDITYKLFRQSGFLFFNSFSDSERYWVSIVAATQGGGSMYATISEQEFTAVYEETQNIQSFLPLFNRHWDAEKEKVIEEKYSIVEAIKVHNLTQYAPKPNRDGVYIPTNEPIKSIITLKKPD